MYNEICTTQKVCGICLVFSNSGESEVSESNINIGKQSFVIASNVRLIFPHFFAHRT